MRPASVVESVEADFCFDVEDLEISGYFELTDDEAYAVETALYTGLGEPGQSARTVYAPYRFAKQRDDDYRRIQKHL